jgi:predicted nucleic acid-binding protein
MTTTALILDSNAIIDLFDGNIAVDAEMRKAGRVLIPAVVCGEVQAGCQGGTKRETKTLELFRALLEKPTVFVHSITQSTGEFYGRLHAFLRERGTPIPTNDIWIAASAMETGSAICTNDAHLLSIPLLRTVPCKL